MLNINDSAITLGNGTKVKNSVSRKEAENAVCILLKWIGEDPEREGLINTPKRFIDSLNEFFRGYNDDPHAVLQTTFTEIAGYKEMILLKNIRVESHCEHHIAPIIGKAHVAYIPNKKVVGVSKLARVVEIFAKRLQIQERLTAEIANIINKVLEPEGVAVVIEADHHCMTTRGVHSIDTQMYTQVMLGSFEQSMQLQQQLFNKIAK